MGSMLSEAARASRVPSPGRRSRARLWAPLVLPVSALLAGTVAHAFPGAVEALYARRLYPLIAALLAWCSRAFERVFGVEGDRLLHVRLSLGEVLLAATVVGIVGLAVRALRRGPLALLRTTAGLAGLVAWAFLAVWGFNYARAPLAVTLGLEVSGATPDELEALARDLASSLSADLDVGPDWVIGARFADAAITAWSRAQVAEPELGWTLRPVVVAPLASRALAAAGISGIFGPFSQEAHVVAGLVPLDRGFIACHEIAHVQGWAREDEANYLAYRVGTRYGSRALRISARAGALRHVLGALRVAHALRWRALVEELDPRIIALYDARARYWEAQRVEPVAAAARGANDAYLRSNGQRAGIHSYGRMVDLLIAERRRALGAD